MLKASDKWNENIHAYAHIVQPDGKRYIQADQITDALARDKYGIAYNRYRGERPNITRRPALTSKIQARVTTTGKPMASATTT